MALIRIGTRGSKLALWQAYYIQDKLQAQGFDTEIVTFETKGDKILNVTLSKIGDKGLFTFELEESLRNGEIDIAVHSAKDLPSTLPDDLEIIAFTEREKAHDVLLSTRKDIDLSTDNLVIGTSSTRRIALLKNYKSTVNTVDMRGNLQTRLQKMLDGTCDAMILAYAGVHRMGMEEYIVQHIDKDILIPPAGQGSVAVEVAKNLDATLKSDLKKYLNEPIAEKCVLTERTYLKKLEGGCSVPIFGHAEYLNETQEISFKAGIVSLDGTQKVLFSVIDNANNWESIANNAYESVKLQGGLNILQEIKQQLAK